MINLILRVINFTLFSTFRHVEILRHFFFLFFFNTDNESTSLLLFTEFLNSLFVKFIIIFHCSNFSVLIHNSDNRMSFLQDSYAELNNTFIPPFLSISTHTHTHTLSLPLYFSFYFRCYFLHHGRSWETGRFAGIERILRETSEYAFSYFDGVSRSAG